MFRWFDALFLIHQLFENTFEAFSLLQFDAFGVSGVSHVSAARCPTTPLIARSVKGSEKPLHAASQGEAMGRNARHGRHLLDVREVAKLLHVLVSWVYGRMRKRVSERLPDYRLGKYWRFHKDEVLAWVDCHREGPHVI